MTTSLPPVAHAVQRAKERYGIELSWTDLDAIVQRCKAGEGFCDSRADGSHFHTIIFQERVLWVVYRRPSPMSPDGVVVTIMPPEKAAALAFRDSRHIKRRTGHKTLRRGWR